MMCKVLSDFSGASVYFNDSFPVYQSQYWVSVSDALPVWEHFLRGEGQHSTVGLRTINQHTHTEAHAQLESEGGYLRAASRTHNI